MFNFFKEIWWFYNDKDDIYIKQQYFKLLDVVSYTIAAVTELMV